MLMGGLEVFQSTLSNVQCGRGLPHPRTQVYPGFECWESLGEGITKTALIFLTCRLSAPSRQPAAVFPPCQERPICGSLPTGLFARGCHYCCEIFPATFGINCWSHSIFWGDMMALIFLLCSVSCWFVTMVLVCVLFLIPVEPVSLRPHMSRVLEPDRTRVSCISHRCC